MNVVLDRLVDGSTEDVAEVSPWIGLPNRIGGGTDSALVKFRIEVAWVKDWELAEQLAPLPSEEWRPVIAAQDGWTSGLGESLLRQG